MRALTMKKLTEICDSKKQVEGIPILSNITPDSAKPMPCADVENHIKRSVVLLVHIERFYNFYCFHSRTGAFNYWQTIDQLKTNRTRYK